MRRVFVLFVTLSLLALSTGCTAIKHRNLDTQLKLQQSVFISPDSIDGRPVYLRVSNQTGKKNIDFDAKVAQKLSAKGYKVTNNAREAGIRMLVNFVYLDQAEEGMSLEGALAGGFGGALIGGLATQSPVGAAVGAAAGAGAGSILGVFVTVDTWYGVIDVQIEEPLRNTAIRRTSAVSNQQFGTTSGEGRNTPRGDSTSSGSQSTTEVSEMQYQEEIHHKKTQTRIVVKAVQTNIDGVEASKEIQEQLSESVANFL